MGFEELDFVNGKGVGVLKSVIFKFFSFFFSTGYFSFPQGECGLRKFFSACLAKPSHKKGEGNSHTSKWLR